MVSTSHNGQLVVATEWDGEQDLRGIAGRIKAFTNDGEYALVEYPTKISNSADGLDPNGEIVAQPGYCYWHKRHWLQLANKPIQHGKKVKEDFTYRGRNLKGMPFRFIGVLPSNEHAVVEFHEDVGGHSADGHGKKGHCVVLPLEAIKK
jgi:hypothetical protein